MADHPRSGVTHDLADSFSHFRSVTMDGTIGADGFVLAEAAGFCPFLSIIKQLFAIGAEIIFSMVIPAVNFDHLMDGLSFSIDALVHEIPLKNSANFSAPLGTYRSIHVSWAGEKVKKSSFQAGGTVSALMYFALREKLIRGAVLTGRKGLLPEFCFFDRLCYGEHNATTDHSPEGTQYISKAGEPECPAHSLPTPRLWLHCLPGRGLCTRPAPEAHPHGLRHSHKRHSRPDQAALS